MQKQSPKSLKWYRFRQNNSGGHFILNDKVCAEIYIEAESPAVANRKAEDIGIYFDGVNKGIDCECCGDRWSCCDSYDKPVDKIEDIEVRLPFNFKGTPLSEMEEVYYLSNKALYRLYFDDGTVKAYTDLARSDAIDLLK